MFGYSIYDAPGGVAYILCFITRCCVLIRYNIITFLDLRLKNCLGWGRFIGTFCSRVVLSAKHLVINKGHIAHV